MLSFSRRFSVSTRVFSDFSHTIIGGGIVGLAIAAELLKLHSNVLLIEQNSSICMETSSRNSEVVHAGIYYPKDSLKSKLCIAGKKKIYKHSSFFGVKNCGKLIVGQSDADLEYLTKIYNNRSEDVPLEFVKNNNSLIRGNHFLLSPSTGIISSHDFALYLLSIFENYGGTIALNTKAKNISWNKEFSSFNVLATDSENTDGDDAFSVTTDRIINLAGLFAPQISNMLLSEKKKTYLAKGNYFNYTSGVKVDQLIYPCPNPNAVSLGTHLTFDLSGQIRFGPDLEWLENVNDPKDIDYTPTQDNIIPAYHAIKEYFPSIKVSDLSPSYSGVRPKLLSKTDSLGQFSDFYIKNEPEFPGFINLLGIESPGLTSSWAIADYVVDLLDK